MRIKAKTDFTHGAAAFVQGEETSVDDGLAQILKQCGLADILPDPAPEARSEPKLKTTARRRR